MSIKDMIRSNRDAVPVRQRQGHDMWSLRHDVNRLFDAFFDDFGLSPMRLGEDRLRAFSPRVDVSETDTEVSVTAELPGLDEKNVEVVLDDNALTIKGEKKDEVEAKTAQSCHLERSFGAFQRTIPLPVQVEPGKAKAVFKRGVLHVTLPKVRSDQAPRRKIEIKAE